MTIFGNRDSAFDGSVSMNPSPVFEELDSAEGPAMREYGAAPDPRRVILRVHGGEDIVVGTADGREPAVELARDMVRHIEQASAKGEWPQVDERFIRPGAILSIDVQRSE